MDTRSFWTRLTLAAFVLNTPISLAILIAGLPVMAGLAASCLLGLGTLTVLDRQRARLSEASRPESTMELRVAGPTTRIEPAMAAFASASRSNGIKGTVR